MTNTDRVLYILRYTSGEFLKSSISIDLLDSAKRIISNAMCTLVGVSASRIHLDEFILVITILEYMSRQR
jgi:hypothetical protein